MATRALRVAPLLLSTAIVLAGCGEAGSGAGTAATGSATPTAGASSADATQLVGLWKVSGERVEPDTILRLGEELMLWRPCGMTFGGWRVGDGIVVTSVFGGASSEERCSPTAPGAPPELRPDWLRAATGFRAEGKARVLLDADGRDVARLTPTDSAPSSGHYDADVTEPPAFPDEDVAALRSTPAPPPAGLVGAGREALVGTWRPDPGSKASLTLRADGSYAASDGCNGMHGNWAVGADGLIVATSGGSTEMGCDNVEVPEWFLSAGRAGLDGVTLVLVDARTGATHRLVRG